MVVQTAQLHWLTIAETAAAYRSKELSPVELTRYLLDRAERLQDRFASFVTLTPDIALEQARAAEKALLAGGATSPLLGMPMGYKDIYFTRGVRTTAGSHLHEDFVPDFDATTVRLLNEAGAVMLGKLTTWEFAGGGADITQSYFPSARNPWNRDHSPYGSSSGSGAALAAGIVAGALGTDTGGSIRFPAAACGISGLKPTYGRCSRYGVFPAAWTLDHTGPMARTVEDCALMLNALAAYDPLDPASANEPAQDYTLGLSKSIKGLRVGVPTDQYLSGCDADMLAAFGEAVETLKRLGAVVVPVAMPERAGFVSAEGHAYHRANLLDAPELYGPNFAQRQLSSGAFFASEYIQSQRVRSLLKAEMREILLTVDLVVSPTMAVAAETMERAAADPVGGRTGAFFARLFNQTGLPSLSVPNGFSGSGLPLSLLISGRPFDEATVLRAGHAYQQVTDWHQRHPEI